MNILYFLLPLALALVLVFVGFYLWAARKGQFDDLESPSQRILLDDRDKNNKKDRKQVNGA
ncbi:cbb3-type cytochrome oxidase assembly protein CcoS [bacterium]|nr:cbb3-type cytochrome oxidase assembly protein CcoS [bacterium]